MLTLFPADNPLQTAVLNLFVTLKARYPNLVVGAITRESVKKALANGITADQVCAGLCRGSGQSLILTTLNRSSVTSPPTPIRKCEKMWVYSAPLSGPGVIHFPDRSRYFPSRCRIRYVCGSWRRTD